MALKKAPHEGVGPDLSVAPAGNNSMSFPKSPVNSVTGTLLNVPSWMGYAEPCSPFSTRYLINGYKRIPEKQK